MLTANITPTHFKLKGPREELEKAYEVMSFLDPDRKFKPTHRLFIQSNGKYGWDGYYRWLNRCYSAGRGLLAFTKERCLKFAGITIEDHYEFERWDSQQVLANLHPKLLGGVTLHQHQMDAITAMWENQACHIRASVASGKTEMFLGAAKLASMVKPDVKVLYLVSTIELLEQVMERAEVRWKEVDLGRVHRDRMEIDSTLVVAMVPTLFSRLDEPETKEFLSKRDILIVDECHLAQAKSFVKVAMSCPAKVRLGGSGTPLKREVHTHRHILEVTGEKVYDIPPSVLIESGHVARPIVHLIEEESWNQAVGKTSWQLEPVSPAQMLVRGVEGFGDVWQNVTYIGKETTFNREGAERSTTNSIVEWHGKRVTIPSSHLLVETNTYDMGIVSFAPRNELIAQVAATATQNGLPTLILVSEILHGIILQQELEGKKVKSRFIDGNLDKKERKNALMDFKKGRLPCLIGTSILKTGVDLPLVRVLIYAAGGKAYIGLRQAIGRGMRKKEFRNVLDFVDFTDPQHRILKSHSEQRLREWAEEGFEIRRVKHIQQLKNYLTEAGKELQEQMA